MSAAATGSVSVTVIVISVVLAQVVPVLILPLFYKIQRRKAPELAERIKRLADNTGLSI